MEVSGKETKPAPELLLAQLILSVFVIVLVSHATYEQQLHIPTYILDIKGDIPVFRPGRIREVALNEFRLSHVVLLQLTVNSAYFFANLLLYVTNKIMKDPILNYTIIILMQDIVFCALMFVCSILTVAHTRERIAGTRETEILIASGVSMFCCVSSGTGVYYSFRVYKGL